MNQDSIIQSEQIIAHQSDALGVITLNRPNALNALSLEMIRQIMVALKRWEHDDSVDAIMFKGAGRSFCAGGDVKSFYNAGMDYRRGHVDSNVPSLYFAEEYSLNKQIFNYPKPTIALMNGIVMGGGYGIAGHCRYRVATENTVFAMPEVRIGFFPDVGSVYHLLRAPHNFGRYLALTGEHIGAGDMMAAKLADFYLDSEVVPAFVEALYGGDIKSPLATYSIAAPSAKIFSKHKKDIESIFSQLDVLGICSALREADNEWAHETLNCILSRAPMSVMVSARHLQLMQGRDFEDVIEADYGLALNFIAYPDLYEGIRSVMIDRDHTPQWEPATLDAIGDAEIDRYFKAPSHKLSDV